MPTYVDTVTCPECGRGWTGHFEVGKEITDDEKICRDCKTKK